MTPSSKSAQIMGSRHGFMSETTPGSCSADSVQLQKDEKGLTDAITTTIANSVGRFIRNLMSFPRTPRTRHTLTHRRP